MTTPATHESPQSVQPFAGFRQHIYIYTNVLFYYIDKVIGCPIITQKPHGLLASTFDWGILENPGNVLSLVLNSNVIYERKMDQFNYSFYQMVRESVLQFIIIYKDTKTIGKYYTN